MGRTAALILAISPLIGGMLGRAEPNPGVPWPATDALGRSLPLVAEVGSSRPDRFVGIFYFINHNKAPRSRELGGPFDVAKILAHDPGAGTNPASPLWGGNGVPHYWAEPLFGYYRGDDSWVLRRHAQMLADAGVDVLIFDATNARSCPDIYTNLCTVFAAIRAEGGRTPQIAFMVNTRGGETAAQIYRELYQPGRFRELWFEWQSRPLMICDPAEADAKVKDFFTLRRAHWPFTLTNTPYAWHWEATYPQPYGFTDNPQQPEQVNVSVAQNLRWDNGLVCNMNSGDARGRSFHNGAQNIGKDTVCRGANFQEQWRRALQLDPPFVMVTGWNEWTAGRWVRPENPLTFVDQYDQEFSRDIEPMRGGHGDNYYWQFVANIRRYKGTPALPPAAAPRTIRFTEGFHQWEGVPAVFLDHFGDTHPRGWPGLGGTVYTNTTGRNDFIVAKVAHDAKDICFYTRTAGKIATPVGANGIWLLLDADNNPQTGWNGYDYIVNREPGAEGAWLEKNTGGFNWRRVASIPIKFDGNELMLVIPRAALGLIAGGFKLDFKWWDNAPPTPAMTDVYSIGDAAPNGRFNFRYHAEAD